MTISKDVQLLLVEDSMDDADLAMRAIKNANVINDIVWLKDGEEAIHYLKGEGKYEGRDTSIKPRVILLDLKLPKIGGVQVLEKIKKDDNLKNIPVVVMTSSKENVDLKRCYELGVNSYVVKPISFSKFSKVIKDISLYWVLVNKIPEDS
ncbi:response regulator [Ekhidna sp.]|uniref:response regulator n=1 Tax=Ekhidna sp. TaxID=2608089 RepID=UPI003CCBBC72